MVTVAVCNRLKPSIGLDTLFNAPMVLLNYVVQILADRIACALRWRANLFEFGHARSEAATALD